MAAKEGMIGLAFVNAGRFGRQIAPFGGIDGRISTNPIAFSAPRYRNIRKTFLRFDEAPTAEGTVVYSIGTLHGEWPDGTAIDGIRYIDRFTVKDGRLVDQNVWNDMAETRSPLPGGS